MIPTQEKATATSVKNNIQHFNHIRKTDQCCLRIGQIDIHHKEAIAIATSRSVQSETEAARTT
jgi:hypothetical protein